MIKNSLCDWSNANVRHVLSLTVKYYFRAKFEMLAHFYDEVNFHMLYCLLNLQPGLSPYLAFQVFQSSYPGCFEE